MYKCQHINIQHLNFICQHLNTSPPQHHFLNTSTSYLNISTPHHLNFKIVTAPAQEQS
ncbi:MAG: hypothetical protein SPE60_00265 [Prevotella sp.]|uniref:hypothetical protein n=1 Tax=Leyella stercorea TaxID=363265 RepID=UPI002801F7EE|nr:hypothetical protein [Leyella stercorea]MDY4198790.1 hypothetical protein [Prevotella sp.]MDY4401129.1 hypothetical protein [Prevotella sp.]